MQEFICNYCTDRLYFDLLCVIYKYTRKMSSEEAYQMKIFFTFDWIYCEWDTSSLRIFSKNENDKLC